MNEELKKLLDSIKAKKQEVKDLCKAGKIEDAANAKEELKNLQAQFDLLYDLEQDVLNGFDLGAEDYITKPFGVMELISRVKALLRRSSGMEEQRLYFGPVLMDQEQRAVFVDGTLCELTYKEYELLRVLLVHAGIVCTRDMILERVWGTDFEGESRTLDMHIKTLRQKLGAAGSMIKTIRNVGYMLIEEK